LFPIIFTANSSGYDALYQRVISIESRDEKKMCMSKSEVFVSQHLKLLVIFKSQRYFRNLKTRFSKSTWVMIEFHKSVLLSDLLNWSLPIKYFDLEIALSEVSLSHQRIIKLKLFASKVASSLKMQSRQLKIT